MKITTLLLLVSTVYCIAQDHSTIKMSRKTEPNEKAFSILVPQDWVTTGGIFRLNPLEHGAANAIAAKVDFSVQKDNKGSVAVSWLPEMLYFDASQSPAGQMGLFPPGSQYNGMTVYPKMTATDFIVNIAFPYARSEASQVRIVGQTSLPKLASNYLKRVSTVWGGMTFRYDAALVTFEYTEGGVSYTEKMLTVIEDWGELGAGMWGNKESVTVRAPKGKLDDWEPILSIIQGSVQIDSKWLAGEIRGQMERSGRLNEVMHQMQEIERGITEHRRKTYAEIHNDMYLTLTDQEEYVNPFTSEIETGSNQWKHRWINEAGDVIYTDDDSYDPRVDVSLNRTDYELSKVRKRFE